MSRNRKRSVISVDLPGWRRALPSWGLFGAVMLLLAPTSPLPGQWVEEPGSGWVEVSLFHQDTRSTFDTDGEEIPIFADGHSVATATFLTGAVGLVPGVDAWIQSSVFQRLRFSDAADRRVRQGIGDTSFFLRAAPGRLVGWDFPLTVRGGVKVPVGDFEVDAEIIPLGDGQTDWELMVEVGHSFHPLPFWAMGWIGHRWREANESIRRDFGDEVFYFAAFGGEAGPVTFQIMGEGFTGDPPIIEGIEIRSARRDLFELAGRVGTALGPGELFGGVRVPLSGRNLVSGETFLLGYFYSWDR